LQSKSTHKSKTTKVAIGHRDTQLNISDNKQLVSNTAMSTELTKYRHELTSPRESSPRDTEGLGSRRQNRVQRVRPWLEKGSKLKQKSTTMRKYLHVDLSFHLIPYCAIVTYYKLNLSSLKSVSAFCSLLHTLL